MTQACVSELMIDRMLAGELAADAEARVRDHAATCTNCGELLGQAEAVARRFATAPPRLRLPAPRATRLAWASTALAAAAALIVVASWRLGPDDGELDIRTKGSPSLGLFVSHGGVVRRGQPGELVAPGDRLQPVATAGRAGWIALTAVDGAGLHTVYAAPRPIAVGRDQPLPFSIVLDDTRGPTVLTAVFCPLPFALDALPGTCTRDAIEIEIR